MVTVHTLEVRIAHLEGAYEQINHRLGSVENRLTSLESTMNNRFAQVDQRLAQMDQKFMWVIGLVVISIILPLAQRYLPH